MGLFTLFKTKNAKTQELNSRHPATQNQLADSDSASDQSTQESGPTNQTDECTVLDEAGIPLTALEKNFLKYMDLKDYKNPYIADYWKFEYNLNPNVLISKFLENNFLGISNYSRNLSLLKNKDLKCILEKYHLPQAGKKADLIQRIKSHVPESALTSLFNLKPYYYLTPEGQHAIKDLSSSATKDPDFEDLCVQSILTEDYQSAYQNICRREIHKNIPRNIGLNWNRELQNGLPDEYIKRLSAFFSTPLPESEIEEGFSKEIKAGVVFGNLLKLTNAQTVALIARRTGLDAKKMHLNLLCQKLLSCL